MWKCEKVGGMELIVVMERRAHQWTVLTLSGNIIQFSNMDFESKHFQFPLPLISFSFRNVKRETHNGDFNFHWRMFSVDILLLLCWFMHCLAIFERKRIEKKKQSMCGSVAMRRYQYLCVCVYIVYVCGAYYIVYILSGTMDGKQPLVKIIFLRSEFIIHEHIRITNRIMYWCIVCFVYISYGFRMEYTTMYAIFRPEYVHTHRKLQ